VRRAAFTGTVEGEIEEEEFDDDKESSGDFTDATSFDDENDEEGNNLFDDAMVGNEFKGLVRLGGRAGRSYFSRSHLKVYFGHLLNSMRLDTPIPGTIHMVILL